MGSMQCEGGRADVHMRMGPLWQVAGSRTGEEVDGMKRQDIEIIIGSIVGAIIGLAIVYFVFGPGGVYWL